MFTNHLDDNYMGHNVPTDIMIRGAETVPYTYGIVSDLTQVLSRFQIF